MKEKKERRGEERSRLGHGRREGLVGVGDIDGEGSGGIWVRVGRCGM